MIHRCVARLAVGITAGGLMAISAVAAQQAGGPAGGPPDLLPFIERLGFPAVAFYLMWRLVTQELRRTADAQERVATAMAELAAQVSALRREAAERR